VRRVQRSRAGSLVKVLEPAVGVHDPAVDNRQV
jgi:hypothetical protein